ncbi:hypothetical protein [Aeromonas veronii]|uniref:hypothetical protein n=1 Tax=Aeromonas veronii TaxID=654 RepID=UPI001F0A7B04|nr:hypothetical protein [Aeromonas veronii]
MLLALASVEGGKNGQFVGNTNGSKDIGHFQINTIHWKQNGRFAQYPRSLNRMSHGAAATTQSLPLDASPAHRRTHGTRLLDTGGELPLQDPEVQRRVPQQADSLRNPVGQLAATTIRPRISLSTMKGAASS